MSDLTEPMRRRGLRVASAIAALCCGLAFVACGGSSSGGGGTSSSSTSSVQVIGGKQAAPSSAAVKSVTWGIGGTPQALNAFQAYDIPTIESLANIQEGLLTLDGQGRLQPALADSWRAVDPVTYIYHLRPGIKFSDGKPVTAQDIIFSMDYSKNPKTGATNSGFYGSVQSITSPSPDEILVKLTHPDAMWKFIPAHRAGWVTEKSYALAHPKDLGSPTAPSIGTGPYKIAEFVPDDHLTLVPNPYFWGPKPTVQKLTLRYFSEAGTQELIAAKTGAIDGTFDVTPVDVNQWEHNPNLNVLSAPSTLFDQLGFNTAKKPWNDVHVRRAIVYSLDRPALIRGLLHGQARFATGWTQPETWLSVGVSAAEAQHRYDTELPQYQFSMAKAKAELAQSSVPHGFSVTVTYPASSTYLAKILEAWQPNLAQLGIHLTIKEQAVQQFYTDVSNRNFGMLLGPSGLDYPDVMDNPYFTLQSRYANPAGFNYANYRNPAMDRVLDAAVREVDPAKRADLSMQVIKMTADALPYQALWWDNGLMAINTRLVFTDWNAWIQFNAPWALAIKGVA